MSGTIWSKFYWSDWETDPALRLCSLAAQGLWMRMLCVAASHDPIGYVAVAGRGLDETALARLTGCQESEVASLLGELERNGVCSRDRQRRIYSRRMVADAKRAALARKNGRKGGNPSLSKDKGNPSPDNPPDKSGHKPQEPYAKNPEVKPYGFPGRASARKNTGFVTVRKTSEAVNDFIQEMHDDEGRARLRSPNTGRDVPMLSAVGTRRS